MKTQKLTEYLDEQIELLKKQDDIRKNLIEDDARDGAWDAAWDGGQDDALRKIKDGLEKGTLTHGS